MVQFKTKQIEHYLYFNKSLNNKQSNKLNTRNIDVSRTDLKYFQQPND